MRASSPSLPPCGARGAPAARPPSISRSDPWEGVGRPEDAAVVHRLAQLCHCVAQGKVGSGFDVAAAVFGSLVYRRFPAATLAPLLQAVVPHSASSRDLAMGLH
jgi:hypothetical protein